MQALPGTNSILVRRTLPDRFAVREARQSPCIIRNKKPRPNASIRRGLFVSYDVRLVANVTIQQLLQLLLLLL